VNDLKMLDQKMTDVELIIVDHICEYYITQKHSNITKVHCQ